MAGNSDSARHPRQLLAVVPFAGNPQRLPFAFVPFSGMAWRIQFVDNETEVTNVSDHVSDSELPDRQACIERCIKCATKARLCYADLPWHSYTQQIQSDLLEFELRVTRIEKLHAWGNDAEVRKVMVELESEFGRLQATVSPILLDEKRRRLGTGVIDIESDND